MNPTATSLPYQVHGATEGDAEQRAATVVLCSVAVFLAAVTAAVATWGLPALAMIALTAVPIMFVVLVLITVGK